MSRQEKIIKAAIEVLLEMGLHAASTRAVTQKAGVGTGLLNHYFRWPDLRATAWSLIFDAVAQDQFSPTRPPDAALEHYFATAFTPDAKTYWLLWSEAVDLAPSDPAMASALGQAQARLNEGLLRILRAGHAASLWHLPDPEATALRLGALYDGLAGLLLSGVSPLTAAQSEQHLRAAFALECRPRTPPQ